MHRIPAHLLDDTVRVVVVGCGGTGSAIAAGLPYLHESMLAFGHPFGLEVTLIDGDIISETNCVRQPFTRSEVGHPKSVILATRLNLFWGLEVDAVHGYLGERGTHPPMADLVIGCVDTRKARATILDAYDGRAHYWLDFGNEERADPDGGSETIGQFVLGELVAPRVGTGQTRDLGAGWKAEETLEGHRLPHVGDKYPELLDDALDVDDGPSCSAAEALTQQAPFVNQVLANHGLALLARLFRYGQIDHQGAFVNLTTGRVAPIPVPEPTEKPRSKSKKRHTRRRRAPA